VGRPHRDGKEVVEVIGSVLSFLGLIIIVAIAFVALIIGLVVRAFRRRPSGPGRTW
jgi:hypothetical protein